MSSVHSVSSVMSEPRYEKEVTLSRKLLLITMLQDVPSLVMIYVFSALIKSPYFLLTLSSRSTSSCNYVSLSSQQDDMTEVIGVGTYLHETARAATF